MTSEKNYYKVLDLDLFASSGEIKKQYFKLVLLYHPDKCNKIENSTDISDCKTEENRDEFNNRFIKIQEAYNYLKTNKENYDRDLLNEIRNEQIVFEQAEEIEEYLIERVSENKEYIIFECNQCQEELQKVINIE